MLYSFIKYLLRIFFPYFFKKVHITGFDKIPKNQPVLLVSNHQNAFLDAVLAAYSFKQNVFFLVRSDLFKKGFINWLFEKLSLIPVFRQSDTTKNRSQKNQETFEKCQSYFEQKKTILIFPEGNSQASYRLEKLKKGAARMALQAEANNGFKLGLLVIPVSITYENHHKAKTTVWIEYDDAISLGQFQSSYEENKIKAINELTLLLSNRLTKMVLQHNWNKDKKNAFFKAVKQQKITSNKELCKFSSQFTECKVVDSKQDIKSNWLLKGLHLPVYLCSRSIQKMVNDKDFNLSIKAFSWLLLGFFELLTIFVVGWLFSSFLFSTLITTGFITLSAALAKKA